MKRLLLASVVLGLAGSIGTANAAPTTPDTSNTVAIWNAATANSGETAAAQQALPSAASSLTQVLATTNYSEPINYDLPSGGTDTIPGFFAASLSNPGQLPPAGCTTGACANNVLSSGGYANVSLFEFTFTTGEESFTVTHDDGVSLFASGTEGACTTATPVTSASCPTDLLPVGDSGPTVADTTAAITLGAGTYDLWYTAANGLPEVLETNSVAVPAPPIGHGLPVILAVGGILFGAKLWERSKRRSPLDTVASPAVA